MALEMALISDHENILHICNAKKVDLIRVIEFIESTHNPRYGPFLQLEKL